MNYYLSLAGLLWCCSLCFAQEVHFKNTDQKVMVTKGDVVHVDTDTAYLVSKSRAHALNDRLDELVATRISNEQLGKMNADLLKKVKDVERLTDVLLADLAADSADLSVDLATLADQLDLSLKSLKENNLHLGENNAKLEQQIDAMDHTVKLLKKEIRGIWWNGVTDKIIVGALGVGLGLLITSLL